MVSLYSLSDTSKIYSNAIRDLSKLYDLCYFVNYADNNDGVVIDSTDWGISRYGHFTTTAYVKVSSIIEKLCNDIVKNNQSEFGYFGVEQIATNKEDIGSLKEDIGNKAPAIIRKASGKTIVINDSSNLPIKKLHGTGKIIITGKNILNDKKSNEFIPFEAKADTLFTLITNGELSEGGNVKFLTENGDDLWFAIDKGQTRVSAKINSNVKGFYNLLIIKEGLKYCFSVGENDEYEEYVEQVITAPVDSKQLKAIHTNYPTTMLTSENEISVEYVADTEAYIEKRIKLEIQNALINQKISGV